MALQETKPVFYEQPRSWRAVVEALAELVRESPRRREFRLALSLGCPGAEAKAVQWMDSVIAISRDETKCPCCRRQATEARLSLLLNERAREAALAAFREAMGC